MSFLYFDCFSGVAGDMIIAALLDAGASFEDLTRAIDALHISARLEHSHTTVQGIRCSSFKVSSSAAPLRHLSDIESIITASSLAAHIKHKALAALTRLAEAEASVHGVKPAEVHFHEIGAVDTIVDIVGTFVCLDSMGIEKVYVSALPWSGGLVSTAHGHYPLPAPAAAVLLQGFPCNFSQAGVELITPTGAVLISSIATPRVDPPAFVPKRIAYGAGHNVRGDGVPNLLRIIEADPLFSGKDSDMVAILETEVDDLNPEVFSYLHQLLLSNPDVLDFFFTPIIMKKNRPGTLLSLLVKPDACQRVCEILVCETGSLGVRYRIQTRYILERSEDRLDTPWGPVRLKVAYLPDGKIRRKPEYEDCQRIAAENHLPLIEVLGIIHRLVGELA